MGILYFGRFGSAGLIFHLVSTMDKPVKQRQSILNGRHRALGSDLQQAWNDMPIPQNYATDPYEEIAAVRYRAGLIDVSALKIVNVSGPEASKFLDCLLTTNVSKMTAGQSHISNIVDDHGSLIDDVLVYCDAPNTFRVSHGGGALEEVMPSIAQRFNVKFGRDDDVHILSLQGPLAIDVLNPHAGMDLDLISYFTHQRTQLFGKDVSIARGGYSGERGYEVFCSSNDAIELWDKILAAGKEHGVIPTSWTCLDIGRVEAGLLFFPFDMTHGDTTPYEVRADWTIDLDKPDFRGKGGLIKRRGKERSYITGLEVDSAEAMTPLAKVFAGGHEVGVVTSAAYSKHLMKSIAMAQIVPSHTRLGTAVDIHDGVKSYPATVVRMPFYDPLRLRTHPLSER